jgi:hypothetical protein
MIKGCFGVLLNPRLREEFTEHFLSHAGASVNKVVWFRFGAMVWSLWLTKNERVFQNKMLFNPLHPVYKAYYFMLQ